MNAAWWKSAVIYQILVRSFQDSNGDGEGDLPGLISRLDYLEELGVDAIWLSPVYDSPWADCGYDVSDYERIHPVYGTDADFDNLVSHCHRRGLRVILDWVPNHTSDRHKWFIDARDERSSFHRDWYVWADATAEGAPPNNWVSVFGGSTWTWDEKTRQFYLHSFLAEQPDLNWRNPAVREAMCQNLRFWANRGVDGFRIDAADMLLKDRTLRSNPLNPDFKPGDAPDNAVVPKYTRNRPGNHRLMAAIRGTVQPWNDCVLMGELYQPPEKLVTYYGTESQPELHLPLNLTLLHHAWTADKIQETISKYYQALGPDNWPCWSLGNHDIRRLASRTPRNQARLAAMLLLTLGGTPTLYYGDEIGIEDVPIPRYLVDDPQTYSWPGHSRDVARTPMQWDTSPQAGFTSGTPWLLMGNYARVNVHDQSEDEKSLLSLYRRLIDLRRRESALVGGRFNPVERPASVVAYERTGDQRLLIVLNFSSEPQSFPVPGTGTIVLNSEFDRTDARVRETLPLRPEEGVILKLEVNGSNCKTVEKS